MFFTLLLARIYRNNRDSIERMKCGNLVEWNGNEFINTIEN